MAGEILAEESKRGVQAVETKQDVLAEETKQVEPLNDEEFDCV